MLTLYGPEFRGNDYIPSPPVDGNPAYKETRSTRKSGDCKKGGGKTPTYGGSSEVVLQIHYLWRDRYWVLQFNVCKEK